MNKWFTVMDMHSGGGRKTPFETYFIEAADKHAAERIFTEETGENPHAVACECCGDNFSVGGMYDTLEAASEFWRRGQTVEEFVKEPRNRVKVIPLTREGDLI